VLSCNNTVIMLHHCYCAVFAKILFHSQPQNTAAVNSQDITIPKSLPFSCRSHFKDIFSVIAHMPSVTVNMRSSVGVTTVWNSHSDQLETQKLPNRILAISACLTVRLPILFSTNLNFITISSIVKGVDLTGLLGGT